MRRCFVVPALASLALLQAQAAGSQETRSGIDWQPVGTFLIARTETTVGQFRRFVDATGTMTRAERQGGEVYEVGWVRKPGWDWRTPFGRDQSANDAEPAVHVTYDEAQAFCG